MLEGKLLHPGILAALASNGHGSRILIADGNYPFTTGSPATATKVFLNLSPGITTVTQVLDAIASTIPLEAADVMVPDDGQHQPVFDEFSRLLPAGVALTRHERHAFYALARGPDTCLVVATGEQRCYANLLLTIGVVQPGDP